MRRKKCKMKYQFLYEKIMNSFLQNLLYLPEATKSIIQSTNCNKFSTINEFISVNIKNLKYTKIALSYLSCRKEVVIKVAKQ